MATRWSPRQSSNRRDVQLRRVEELAALDTRSALAELIAARAAWEATAGTVEQANRAYEIAEVRYEAGVSTQLELSDSRLLLQQAEANRAQAGRDLQVARARIALLPDLPIGVGGSQIRTRRSSSHRSPRPHRRRRPPHPLAASSGMRRPRPAADSSSEGNSDSHAQCTMSEARGRT